LEIWLEKPDTSTFTILHAHDIILPHGLDYSDPAFRSFILPSLPPGVYTWHAALLDPPTHDVLLEDTEKWAFEIQYPLEGNIQIGITSSSTGAYNNTLSLVEIVEPKINEYVQNLGHDITFEFVLKDNEGSAAKALENTMEFKATGIDLIIGHGWSSQCQASLSYANENNMLLLSASSTSPILAIPDDRLFRTCPNDVTQAPALGQMWKTWGAEAVLTMHRGDVWGDGLYNLFEQELVDLGIENLGHIRYPGNETDFMTYLDNANNIITLANMTYGFERIGMQFFSFAELRTIQIQAADYPNLIDIIWMTTEGGGRSQAMLDEAGQWATKTRHFSPFMRVAEGNPEFIEFNQSYYDLTGITAGFYTAAQYDACWLMAKCILETCSTDASDIARVLIPVSQKYYGITGWLALDENGDRVPQMYDIWGYYEDPDTHEYKFREFGLYMSRINKVWWDDEALLQYAGIIRPGFPSI
jgi:branched-chain amino acid transport system substrate-binding protein